MEDGEELLIEEPFVMRERELDATYNKARIPYLVCEPLEKAGFMNAFSTRKGGVSPLPSESLNLAQFKGDTQENVSENRRRFLKAIGADHATLVTARQTHSIERLAITSLEQAEGPQPDCDAM